MTLVFNTFIDINSLPTKKLLCSQDFRWPRSAPIALFPGQDISWAKTAMVGHDNIVPSRISLTTIEDGYFVIGDGYDGLILSRDLECLEVTSLFTHSAKHKNPEHASVGCHIPFEVSERVVDEVFVGFDGRWMNYFHWLCYTLTRSYFAARTMPSSCLIALPGYAAHVADPHGGPPRKYPLPERVWTQSLEMSSLSERVSLFAPGIYRAKKIHAIWPETKAPTDLLYADPINRAFSKVRSVLERKAGPLNRIFISRSGSRDGRIDTSDEQTLVSALTDIGFQSVRLEQLSFLEQANLFYNAEIVVAPHGAGLTNIVFGPEELRVLELNRRIEGDNGNLRPWFYMLACTRNQHYGFLDGTQSGFSLQEVLNGIETLLKRDLK